MNGAVVSILVVGLLNPKSWHGRVAFRTSGDLRVVAQPTLLLSVHSFPSWIDSIHPDRAVL